MLTHLLSPQFPQLLHSQDDPEYGFPIYRVFSSPRSETNIKNHRMDGWNRQFLDSKQFFNTRMLLFKLLQFNTRMLFFKVISLNHSWQNMLLYRTVKSSFEIKIKFEVLSLNQFMAEHANM